jgi:hypothetical protein
LDFLVSKIAAKADSGGNPLSEIERKMLREFPASLHEITAR